MTPETEKQVEQKWPEVILERPAGTDEDPTEQRHMQASPDYEHEDYVSRAVLQAIEAEAGEAEGDRDQLAAKAARRVAGLEANTKRERRRAEQAEKQLEEVREKLTDWDGQTLRKKEMRVAEVLELVTPQPSDTASEAPRCGGEGVIPTSDPFLLQGGCTVEDCPGCPDCTHKDETTKEGSR